MELQPGKSLAHYRLVEKIGEGGMGVVWKADDTKLGRQVAIKILPEVFARDAERMARFSREAQLLAALNHPNVAAIYGLEEQGPLRGLVLELIDGETLAERIARGPVPMDEALRLAAQIAEAMEAAHATGTIHRDLKPGNVKVTERGTVKVLDFGLAKALVGDTAAGPDSTQSPTITASPTQAGIILGTASYMSPEQARGRPADRRSDVWSFGVILFEMLTGGRLFTGETITDVLAAVVRAEPEWEKLPAGTPAPVRKLLRRCLSKDPERRLRDFGDILLEIREAGDDAESVLSGPAAALAAPPSALRRVAWAAGIPALVAAAGIGGWMLAGSVREDPVLITSILPPDGTRFHLSMGGPGVPALSPDGRMLAFTATAEDGEGNLYVRRLASREAYLLTGTESAQYPFWSPDGRHLGFFSRSDGKLKRIPVSGGPPVTLCDAENGKGGAWGTGGTIVFTPGPGAPLFKVRDTGGDPSPVTELDTGSGDASHRHPVFLPGADRLLFFVHRVGKIGARDSIAAVGLDGGAITHIIDTDVGGAYASGHLLFVRDQMLMAQPFDPDRLLLSGEPAPVIEHVAILSGAYKAVFSASSNGRVAFVQSVTRSSVALKLVDPASHQVEVLGEEASMNGMAVSPDGSRVAIEVLDPVSGTYDIWIQDLDRNLRTRLTFEPEDEWYPVWSRDSERVFYSSEETGWNRVKVKDAAGFGDAEVAIEWERALIPQSVSPDGEWLTARSTDPETKNDVWVFPLHEGADPYRIVGSRFVDVDGIISPDGKWMAYVSMESGRPEIYVTSFPNASGKWQVSTSGGDNPLWSHDGRKIYYQDPAGMIMEVPVQTGASALIIGRSVSIMPSWHDPYDYRYGVLPDGKFLIMEETGTEEDAPVTLITNWPRMLEEASGGS